MILLSMMIDEDRLMVFFYQCFNTIRIVTTASAEGKVQCSVRMRAMIALERSELALLLIAVGVVGLGKVTDMG